jgi:hypothetical protein
VEKLFSLAGDCGGRLPKRSCRKAGASKKPHLRWSLTASMAPRNFTLNEKQLTNSSVKLKAVVLVCCPGTCSGQNAPCPPCGINCDTSSPSHSHAVGVVRCDAAGNCVMVQREMETGRSPLVSIARASAGTERADCNWLQKEIMVAMVGAHGAPD